MGRGGNSWCPPAQYPGGGEDSLPPPSGGGTDPDLFVPIDQTAVKGMDPFLSPLKEDWRVFLLGVPCPSG